MSRKIKFRIWDTKDRQMVYNTNDLNNDYSVWISLDGYIYATYKLIGLNKDEIILMQFIGLKDKKEKEIYEGDIVFNGKEYRRVDWVGAGFWFVDIYGGSKDIEPTPNEVKNWKVVGNIFENSKFLHKK